jgi:hypothetical protein
MLSVTDWWKTNQSDNQNAAWLIVGKGPSFEKRAEFDLSPYRVITLNHVIREMPAEIAHVIDLDVIRDCGDAIVANAKFLLMPRRPHVNGKAQEKTLDALLREYSPLQKLDEQNRLIVYDLAPQRVASTTSPWQKQPANPDFIVPLGTFSGEVVTTLLGMLGAKKIRTLGLDGGKNYAGTFSDLRQTQLDNGHQSFDVQASGIADAIQRYNLDYGALDTEVPMRIFIGADETQLLGAKILEYSVRKHSTVSSVFDDMMHVRAPVPQDPKNQARTNFSFNRFAIPKLAGYHGRAVYVDADMQVFRDFREMWDTPFNGAKVLYARSNDPKRPKQFSVLLLDCARLDWDLDTIIAGMDEGKYDYDKLMKEMCIEAPEDVQPGLPVEWNSLEEFHAGKTGLIHYTDMHTQPWVSRANPNGGEFVAGLKSALKDEFIKWPELVEAKNKKYVRPSLLMQLKLPRSVWPQFNKTYGRILDRGFKPHEPLFTRLETGRKQAAAPTTAPAGS